MLHVSVRRRDFWALYSIPCRCYTSVGVAAIFLFFVVSNLPQNKLQMQFIWVVKRSPAHPFVRSFVHTRTLLCSVSQHQHSSKTNSKNCCKIVPSMSIATVKIIEQTMRKLHQLASDARTSSTRSHSVHVNMQKLLCTYFYFVWFVSNLFFLKMKKLAITLIDGEGNALI